MSTEDFKKTRPEYRDCDDKIFSKRLDQVKQAKKKHPSRGSVAYKKFVLGDKEMSRKNKADEDVVGVDVDVEESNEAL